MGMLELHVLRSGDKGSCAAVRLAAAEEFVCVDCGITGATFADACAQTGLIPFKVQAFLITHCHSNQVKGLKSTLTWLQKRGVAPQVYVEPGVLAASPVLQELQGIADVCEFHTKQPFWVGDVCVRPFRTFHNNEDKGSCYNFRFETRVSGDEAGEQADSLVLLSDVGVLSREAQGELPHARLLAIEANYDASLLDEAAQANPQVRFAVDVRGNFSNAQAASTVQAYAWPGLKDVVALYLSRQYNAPSHATAAIKAALEQAGCKAHVACASPDEALSVLPESESAGDGNGMAPEKPAVESAAAEMPSVKGSFVTGGVANMAAPEASVSEMPGRNAAVETPVAEMPATVGTAAGPVEGEPVSGQLTAGEIIVEPIASGTLAGDGFTDKDPIAEMPTLEAALGAVASETCVFETPAHEVGVETTASETSFETPACEEPAPEQPAAVQPAPEQPAHEPPALEAPASYSAPEDILLPEQAREMGYIDLQGLLALWVQQGRLTESPAISAEDLLRALTAADMLDPRDMTPTDKGIELGVWAAFETEGLAPVFAARMADRLWEHVQALL